MKFASTGLSWGVADHQDMEKWNHGGGFSLDAAVRIAANHRRWLERLMRYWASPSWRP